ncbi:probable ATP-dependent RNA helicase DDX49 [Eriocheir sinensis]|uniref:probable ATP-dependent RNA helicase DDX49 n=1 Tax=Eriocheir sinensis TaxID=95602 RepID=UPI0021C7867A|nr:probable ATP-dependent RNA helicase DDX49 [Eriocheir sinensis]XP_050697694.1 probable ATP-dependent RNA helicase DDX49 [Eriocheir sinensis]
MSHVGEGEPSLSASYGDLPGLQPWVVAQLKQLKILRPTPIQQHCIPPALDGRDIIGAAKTGSGKTLAFVIPILQKLSNDPFGIHTLVLTPTRELAFQIADQFRGVGAPVSLRLSVVVGGLDIVGQGRELSQGPHVVVATPGRLADLLQNSPDFTLKRIKFLVLDEADRLMDGRFDGQLRTIWAALPEKRQTLLFSATITDRLQRMRELATSEVFVWRGDEGGRATVEELTEEYALVTPVMKDATLVATVLRHTQDHPKDLVMVFTDTCKRTQVLKMMLGALGIEAAALHSMLSQRDRLAALARFKSSQIKVLIATDLASRGLDIPLVGLVINHVVPNLPKTYIHRVGRTARAGRKGLALTLITPHEIKVLLAIEGETRRKMTEKKVDEAGVTRIMKQVNVTRRMQEIRLDQTDFDERRNINKRKRLILEGRDPDEEEKRKKKKLKKTRQKEKKERKSMLEDLEQRMEVGRVKVEEEEAVQGRGKSSPVVGNTVKGMKNKNNKMNTKKRKTKQDTTA